MVTLYGSCCPLSYPESRMSISDGSRKCFHSHRFICLPGDIEMARTRCRVLLYRDSQGRSQVQEFIDSLTPKEQRKVLALIQVLEEQGAQLPRPHADILRDGIHELRIQLGGKRIRILYFFSFRYIALLTHSFVKNVAQVPEEEIRRAVDIRTGWYSRFPNPESMYAEFPELFEE